MKLSIITINYNNRDGLQRTIDSVICQTWHDFEWIVIDGGSTDGSKELIEKYQNHFAYWCSEPDKGVYNAMNKGITKAKGEYLNFMNSGDCFYNKYTLQKVFKSEWDAEIIYGDCEQIYEKHTRIFTFPSNLNLYDLYRCNICQQAMFIQKQLLSVEGFNESYYLLADWARWIKAALNGATFKHSHQIICKYDMSGMSSTNEELARIDFSHIKRIYPQMVIDSLQRLDDYEKNTIIQRTISIINKGRLSRFFLRFFLKVMIIVTYRNKMPNENSVKWIEG